MPPKINCRKVECEKAIFLGDWHYPLADEHTAEIAFKFLSWFKPHALFILGDFLDCGSVSKFVNNPDRALDLQADCDAGAAVLKRLRRTCPGATIKVLEGNHERRIVKYLWSGAKELSKLRCLQLPNLLQLGDIGALYYDVYQPVRWHGLHVEHGDRASKHSGYTARAMLEARGVSGISGHTHRLGAYYRTDESGVKAWFENACLCRLDMEYIIGAANWQHGFSLGFSAPGKKRWNLEQCPIVDHVLFYAGREWRV